MRRCVIHVAIVTARLTRPLDWESVEQLSWAPPACEGALVQVGNRSNCRWWLFRRGIAAHSPGFWLRRSAPPQIGSGASCRIGLVSHHAFPDSEDGKEGLGSVMWR